MVFKCQENPRQFKFCFLAIPDISSLWKHDTLDVHDLLGYSVTNGFDNIYVLDIYDSLQSLQRKHKS